METTTDLQALTPDCSNDSSSPAITPFEHEMVSIAYSVDGEHRFSINQQQDNKPLPTAH